MNPLDELAAWADDNGGEAEPDGARLLKAARPRPDAVRTILHRARSRTLALRAAAQGHADGFAKGRRLPAMLDEVHATEEALVDALGALGDARRVTNPGHGVEGYAARVRTVLRLADDVQKALGRLWADPTPQGIAKAAGAAAALDTAPMGAARCAEDELDAWAVEVLSEA